MEASILEVMWKNYLKIAFRNSWKNKTFSLINILGLAIGMASCFLIVQYVLHERSYDDFHTNGDRLYRLNYQIRDNYIARTPPTWAPALQKDFPEVEAVTRWYPRDVSIGVAGTNTYFESDRTFFADASTTQVFDLDFVAGDEASALQNPFSVVITESMAERLFGNTDALGNNVKIGESNDYQVTGIVKDWPENADLPFEALVHFDNMIDMEPPHAREGIKQVLETNKVASHSFTYLLLKPQQEVAKFEARLAEYWKTFGDERFRDKQTFTLSPIKDLHLYPPDGSSTNANMLYLFIAIGFIILLIAAINFINLTTASSLSRAKEVGVRKVLGAQRSGLIGQFLGESMLLSFIAFLLSLSIASLAMPYLNSLTGLHLSFAPWEKPNLLASFIGIFILSGFLAGAYPAFFVSRFQATAAMKGRAGNTSKPGGVTLRKTLITLQFLVAVAFISGAAIIFLQLDFLRNQPIGFKQDLLLNVPIDNQMNINSVFRPGDASIRQKMNTLDDILMQNPNIQGVTQCSSQPGFGAIRRNVWSDKIPREENFFPAIIAVDYDYAETLGLEIIAGRDFGKSFGSDHISSFIVNETAVSDLQFGSPEEALGGNITVEGKAGSIVGVVKDFHFRSLRNSIEPLILEVRPGAFRYYGISLRNADVPQTLAFIESQWNDFFPGKVFEYQFLDEAVDQAYQQESQLTGIISYFAFLAIFISCFGLFGLAVLLTRHRTKEIGIRKILGASIPQLLHLLAIDFLKLIALAILLAIPLTWYFLHSWMEAFAYRLDYPWWVSVAAGLFVLTLAFLTISTQTIQTARSNPSDALRYE